MKFHVDLPRFVLEPLLTRSFFQQYLYSAAVQKYWDTKAASRFSLLDHLSPQGCPQELTASRHAVDDELSALHMVMCAMRTRRNDFTLIGRLPPEILSHIFSFHTINQPILRSHYNLDRLIPTSYIRHRLGWIDVTHVCRRWRQVALSDPNLWSTVVFDLGAEWADEMLARSKAALISYSRDLSLSSNAWRTRTRALDDIVTLGKHLSHIRRLALFGYPEALQPAMRALTSPAPHLESLELWNRYELSVALPSNLFAHDAPKLRHVTLVGCAVPWGHSSLFSDSLTHLDIRVPSGVSFPSVLPAAQPADLLSIPTLERLLSILEAMPSLQVLTLGNCLPRAGSTSRVVSLRHMSKLSLDGYLSEVVAILKRVSLPRSASLSLRCPDHNPLDGLLDTLVSLLASHFRAPGTSISPLSTIAIDQADIGPFLTIAAWDTDVLLDRPEFRPSEPARLHLAFGSQYKTLVESLPLQVCKALPLQDLQTLSVTYPDAPWSAADWVDLCSLCPKVTHLFVRAGWALTLFPTLTQRNDAFPSLVTLDMQGIEFFSLLSPEHTEPLGEVFLAILRARSNAGIPVRRITLKSCLGAGRWMKSYGEVVDDVTWDLINSESESESSSAFEHDYDDSLSDDPSDSDDYGWDGL